MKFHKKRNAILSVLCVVSLLLSVCSVLTFAVTASAVTATTNATVRQGNTEYCYVSIDSTESLAALDVTVHFDNTKVKVVDVYNSLSCTMYDNVVNLSDIQFSYLLDGVGVAEKTQLFYFSYQVLSNANLGETYFDITVGEAYDQQLNDVSVSGSRCKFTVAKTTADKSCALYASEAVSTSVSQEFSVSYCFETSQIASGSAVITYDNELFQVVDVANGAFLEGKIVDVNAEADGAIYLSFVGTEYNSSSEFVTVKFKTLKNISETSQIKMKITDLCDKELNPISCSGSTTNVNVTVDSSYIEDAPAMTLSGEFSYEQQQITLVVSLEEDSRLGAGDFAINFDPNLVTYTSSVKGFAPSYFNINDKNVSKGVLKFSIISLSDITTEETVLTVVFTMKQPYSGETAEFTISGSSVTDSLTEDITLNYVDASVPLEYQVIFQYEDGTVIARSVFPYGATVTAPSDPTPPSADYVFAGWDKEITACQGDIVYTAVFALKPVVGDYDSIRGIDNRDVEYLLWHILYPDDYPVTSNADLNGDGKVTDKDVEYLLWHTLFPEEYPLP